MVMEKKISDAKMIQIKLNGAIIHENVSLSGPTGGSISEKETEKGRFCYTRRSRFRGFQTFYCERPERQTSLFRSC